MNPYPDIMKTVLNVLALAITLAAWSPSNAAEIRLRGSTKVDAPIVRLGDIADVTAAFPNEVQMLAAIELFPSPSPERYRFVRSREIVDQLVRRGVDFSVHRVSGSEVTKITREKVAAAMEPSRRGPMRSQDRKAAEERLKQVILDYCTQQTTSDLQPQQLAGLELKFDADDELLHAASTAERLEIVATATSSFALGEQQFLLLLDQQQFSLDVTIEAPTGVVVANRPLSRGAVIRAMDVRMEYETSNQASRAAYHAVEPLIGKQLTSTIGEGRPLAKNSVRDPIVVERGNVVTVLVRVGGIEVRTSGKAQDEASLGQVVEIQSLEDRERKFHARATGRLDPQTGLPVVEVYGEATTTQQ